MQSLDVRRESAIVNSARVTQIRSIFDIEPKEAISKEWKVDLDLDWEWNIGLIVGPSGCGKTTIARELFGDAIDQEFPWSREGSLLDDFPKSMKIQELSELLSSVGLGTIMSWLQPYHTLSNGEAFRARVARAIAENQEAFCIDEFTSVVDRQVAKVVSHSTQKALRKLGRSAVFVSCHSDIIEWLQPDWVYHPLTGEFQRGRVRRIERIEFKIKEVSKEYWEDFRQYHYMSSSLVSGAKCAGLFLNSKCIGFIAWYRFPHPKVKNIVHIHRLVILPDYQGLSLGRLLLELIAKKLKQEGEVVHLVTAHPLMRAYCCQSFKWRKISSGVGSVSVSKDVYKKKRTQKYSAQRSTSSFKYIGEKL